MIAAGPWTIFAPTNAAFSNLPILELSELVDDKARLTRFLLNHLVNRSMYSAGMRSHQVIEMANGSHVNLFARRGLAIATSLKLYFRCIFWLFFSGTLKIEGSNVINIDIPATNGVVHVLENVIKIQTIDKDTTTLRNQRSLYTNLTK